MQNCKGKNWDNSCVEDTVSSQGAGAGGGGMSPGNTKGNRQSNFFVKNCIEKQFPKLIKCVEKFGWRIQEN